MMTKEEFKNLRLDLRLNQTEFGMMLGYSKKGAQRAVCEIEVGKRPIQKAIGRLAGYIMNENKELIAPRRIKREAYEQAKKDMAEGNIPDYFALKAGAQ